MENGEVVTYPNAQAMLDAQDEAPFIDHFYVVPDLERRGQLEVQTFATFEEAYAAYSEFSTENVKALGVQNTNPLPGSLDLIQCREGKDVLVEDYLQVEGWNNPEISAVVNRIQEALQTQEKSVQETDSQPQQEMELAPPPSRERVTGKVRPNVLYPEIESNYRTNFRIEDDNIGVGTPLERFHHNIMAIQLLHKLENEHRLADTNGL